MQPFGALWLADYVGAFLTAGGQAAYFYQDEPLPMYQGCGGWGTFGMFVTDQQYHVRQASSQYFAAQMLTQEWAEPVDQIHQVYPASTNIVDRAGNILVTAYSVLRPDGQWAVLLVNKEKDRDQPVEMSFSNQSDHTNHYFTGQVDEITFGSENYTWHIEGANGHANPDGPAILSTQPGGKGTQYLLPKASITVLRGKVQ
jgi:hypothetical protein